MLLKSLEYFVALSQEQHFGRAAIACGISQPTLSTAIKQLEKELKVPLVRRGQRFLGFTPEGIRVLEWSERILADQDAMLQEISKLRNGLEGRLRLGVVPTALSVLPYLTAPFGESNPSVTVSIRSMSSQAIQKAIDNFEIDMGITYLHNEPLKRVKITNLYKESYSLMVPNSSELANQDNVSWKEAASLPLCLLSTDMQNRRIIDAAFADAGVEAHPAIETNSISNLAPQVATGQWSAVVPRHIEFSYNLPSSVCLVQLIDPDITHEVGVIISEREPQPPTAKAMLNVIKGLKTNNIFNALQ